MVCKLLESRRRVGNLSHEVHACPLTSADLHIVVSYNYVDRPGSRETSGSRSGDDPAVDSLRQAARPQSGNAARDRGSRPRSDSRGRRDAASPFALGHDALGETNAERRRGNRPLSTRALTLVVDASVAVPACLAATGFEELPDEELVAPALLWSETRSALHELIWRRAITAADGEAAREALERCPVRRIDDVRLGLEAWQIADELGWAKTYDAEYVALARLLGCRLVTLDARLRRSVDHLGLAVSVDELL